MPRPSRTACAAALAAAALVAAGCGGSSKSSSSASSSSGQAALAADARSASTGDIPDNQNFLTFANAKGGYTIRYPEGWAQAGGGRDVTFRDKNNLVHIVVASGSAPTVSGVRSELTTLKRSSPTLQAQAPQQVTIKGKPMVKLVYTTRSAPNPVTGKRVTLLVDRYELAKNGKRATVELGTPRGVDNVDAYRMMIESFTWR
ncbi:MAG TPA: PsbP-related protein [Solirubrobacteraceae bacterium]|nr:PsbP-related protein [Solirubrobacteraceae bacterium]